MNAVALLPELWFLLAIKAFLLLKMLKSALRRTKFGIFFLSIFVGCWALIKIQINEKTTIEWSGCLLKKFPIYPWENTSCSECAANGDILVKFDDESAPVSQNYRNCSGSCRRPTICTEYKYNIDDVFRSECYQCEHSRKEAKFRSLRSYKICSDECKQCAKDADLSTAIYCSFKCNGNPTFCYPTEMWFGHHKCYQSSLMYGCTFNPVPNASVNSGCMECASTASDRLDAQQCASECHGIPTYSHSNQLGKKELLQCQIGAYHEVFEYNIPPRILQFLKIETPLSLSKAIRLLKFVPTVTPVVVPLA